MHVLSTDSLTARVHDRVLFADLSFGLTTEDRVAVVGANGSGKSTLLRILVGDRTPDAGRVIAANDARIGWLPQSLEPAHDLTARAVVLGGPDAGVQRHEADALLDRLEIVPDALVGTLSGGQRRRVALARTLAGPADLLVLDEPTNHLDVDSIAWLEEELERRACGLLLVTHDRYVLERLTTRILELEDGAAYWHDGGYSVVLEAREARAERAAAATQHRRNLLRKEIAWLRRDPKARTTKPKFRLEQAERALAATRVDADPPLQLGTGRRRLGSDVLELSDVTVRFGDRTVLAGVDVGLGPGDRVGVVGANGSGKTTLLRVMTGDLEPDAGSVRTGRTVEFGTYAQESRVPPDDTRVIETILAVAPHVPLATGEVLPAGRLAERFGFDERLQHRAVADLSGGERRRLALLHLLVGAPNVIVLDEPTNDLDLDTLAVLEDHLDGFTGTLVVASHDRFLLDRLTDRTLAVEDGRVTAYLDWQAWHEDRQARRSATAAAGDAFDTASAAANRERQERRRELRSLEQRLDRLERRRAELEAALAAAGADHERALVLDRDLRAVRTELAEVEERWLAAADAAAS